MKMKKYFMVMVMVMVTMLGTTFPSYAGFHEENITKLKQMIEQSDMTDDEFEEDAKKNTYIEFVYNRGESYMYVSMYHMTIFEGTIEEWNEE